MNVDQNATSGFIKSIRNKVDNVKILLKFQFDIEAESFFLYLSEKHDEISILASRIKQKIKTIGFDGIIIDAFFSTPYKHTYQYAYSYGPSTSLLIQISNKIRETFDY